MGVRRSPARSGVDHRRVRLGPELRRVLTLIDGADTLLPLEGIREQVAERVRATATARRELNYIPLDAVAGSVGGYDEFARAFLRRAGGEAARANVMEGAMLAPTGFAPAVGGPAGMPPIEVYRLGDAYFVRDGNRRVAAARRLGARQIDAYVFEVDSKEPVADGLQAEGVIRASEREEFREQTNLDEVRPGADVTITAPGGYPALLEQIHVHRYLMGLEMSRPIAWEEAVEHWYDAVYLPVTRAIRQFDLLDGFQGRTEADLYLFLAENRAELASAIGAEAVAAEGPTVVRRFSDLEERAEQLTDPTKPYDPFGSLLLCLHGDERDEDVLAHGVTLARREGAALHGLLLPAFDDGQQARGQAPAPHPRHRFEAACEEAGLEGQLAESRAESLREAVREVQARARYVEVVVAPSGHDLSLALLRNSPKPVLLATSGAPGMERPLLAYDGGAEANEALFLLAYLAVKRGLEPTILHVERRGKALDLTPSRGRRAADVGAAEARGDRREAGRHGASQQLAELRAELAGGAAMDEPLLRGRVEESTLARAGRYLESLGVRSQLISAHGSLADTIVRVAEERGADSIFVGGHSRLGWLERTLGGVLAELMLRTELPLLVT